MELSLRKSTVWSTGLAMFSMFFGAGNIVFPLALGQFTQDKNFYAVVGMILTAVIVPLIGLLAMVLFEGNYASFFRRIGRIPGFMLTLLILGLIGPFGGIPRCITISHSTLSAFGSEGLLQSHLPLFSLLSCGIIFLFTFRPNKIIPLLGYVLTPVLLISLGIIVAKGMFSMPDIQTTLNTPWQTFSKGFVGGYNTMDLLAAFFFSSVVLLCMKKEAAHAMPSRGKMSSAMKVALFASLFAAILLALVYISFSYLAAGFSPSLANVSSEHLLGTLAYQLLGPYAGLIAGVAVSFACLTTEIALTVVISEFLRKIIFREKVSHTVCIAMTLIVSFFISTLQFQGISSFLAPVLQLFYPALIVLTILNILYKLYDFKPVKSIFYTTVGLSLLGYFIHG